MNPCLVWGTVLTTELPGNFKTLQPGRRTGSQLGCPRTAGPPGGLASEAWFAYLALLPRGAQPRPAAAVLAAPADRQPVGSPAPCPRGWCAAARLSQSCLHVTPRVNPGRDPRVTQALLTCQD